jgi:hypothetical protein
MTPGERHAAKIDAISESLPKLERIRLHLEAQLEFQAEVEAFRAGERKRLKKLLE